MTRPTTVVWFRRDLRPDDHPALAAAAGDGPVVPLFVVDDALVARAGPNRRRFLAGALRALDRDLGGGLVLRRGDPRRVVPAVAAEAGAAEVVVTADAGPTGRSRDLAVARALADDGRGLRAVGSPYAVTPGTLRSGTGRSYQVFTAFHRAWLRHGWPLPAPDPVAGTGLVDMVALDGDVDSGVLEEQSADPTRAGLPSWWEGLPLGPSPEFPVAGAAAARDLLDRFLAGPLDVYASDRDLPGTSGTSGLSPHLRFGCVHPRTVLARLGTGTGPGPERFRAELAWREFCADVLRHRPDATSRSLAGFGDHLRTDDGPRARERFAAWATGRTGYPLVDAGMRQLLAEGWMHNRVRMVTASFLVKDLHLDWRWGARWFLWHLVDGDPASNQLGWQWVAGTGTDAAPFHRVLNPTLQQERFDPDGTYVRRYLGGPTSGVGPVVDHAAERREALARVADARLAAAAVREGDPEDGGSDRRGG